MLLYCLREETRETPTRICRFMNTISLTKDILRLMALLGIMGLMLSAQADKCHERKIVSATQQAIYGTDFPSLTSLFSLSVSLLVSLGRGLYLCPFRLFAYPGKSATRKLRSAKGRELGGGETGRAARLVSFELRAPPVQTHEERSHARTPETKVQSGEGIDTWSIASGL